MQIKLATNPKSQSWEMRGLKLELNAGPRFLYIPVANSEIVCWRQVEVEEWQEEGRKGLEKENSFSKEKEVS